MNSRERVQAAMDLLPVDKIPFMCQMSWGHMLTQLKCSPLEFWFDPDIYIDGLLKLRDQYSFDGILVSLHGHNPNWRENFRDITIIDNREVGTYKNGDKIFCPYNELPIYEFVEKRNRDMEERELPEKLNYIPVSQNLYFYIHQEHKFDVLNRIIDKTGKKYSIHGEITSPFDYFMDFLGHQNALMELLINPDHVHRILKHFTRLIKELADEMSKRGIDAIKISSPFAGSSFISPGQYIEFVLPYEKEIVEVIRKYNIHVYIHTCGAINDRLESMFDSGASGIECLDPKPLGDVDLSEAVERIGSRGFIKGNIDSVNLMLDSTPGEIEKEIKEIIKEGSKSKGFILSTACSIAPGVKKESIMLIRKLI